MMVYSVLMVVVAGLMLASLASLSTMISLSPFSSQFFCLFFLIFFLPHFEVHAPLDYSEMNVKQTGPTVTVH